MKFLLQDRQIDRVIDHRRTLLLGGLFVLSLPFVLPKGWGFGLTGFMILSLGIYASALRNWRTEPGLWMLALFLTMVLGASWLYFEVLSLRPLFEKPDAHLVQQKRTWAQVGFLIDGGIALGMFGKIVWFAASVAWANWAWTQVPWKK